MSKIAELKSENLYLLCLKSHVKNGFTSQKRKIHRIKDYIFFSKTKNKKQTSFTKIPMHVIITCSFVTI